MAVATLVAASRTELSVVVPPVGMSAAEQPVTVSEPSTVMANLLGVPEVRIDWATFVPYPVAEETDGPAVS
ncbi:hypothetical protein ACWD4N_15120 [Streptomyces sp. NPDC002586]